MDGRFPTAWNSICSTFSIAYLLLSLCQISVLNAQAQVVDAVPQLADRLASPKDENPTGTLINSTSFSEFKELIPTEFQLLIESGILSFSAFRSWRSIGTFFDDQWTKEGEALAQAGVTVETLADSGIPRAFPFGSADKILQQPVLSVSQRVEQILWNTQASSAARASCSAEFLWREEKTDQYLTFRGVAQRVVPKKFRPEDKTRQLFRERVTFLSPKAMQGLSWLTFRFIADSEDVVWSYSPAIKKMRQLVGTNRSDSFLGTPAALDDLFGFSTKIQTVEGVAISEELMLAPFLGLDSLTLKVEEPGCFNSIAETIDDKGDSHTHSPQLASKLGLDSTKLVFVPRPVFRLDLMQRDPYALVGRQIVYIDKELFVPLYKVSYDRAGALQKLVIIPHAAVHSPDGQVHTWVPTATFVYDLKAKSLVTITYTKVRFCEQSDTKADLATFDPKALIPPAAESIKRDTVKKDLVNVDPEQQRIPVTDLAPAATPTVAHTSGE